MSALENLSGQWTLPYRRGAEFVALDFADSATNRSALAPYDFSDYRARWGEDPAAPAYIVLCQRDLASSDEVTLRAAYHAASPGAASVTVAAGARTGDSFCLPLPADPSLRLVSLEVSPSSGKPVQADWSVVALLGNIAKFNWILGAEKDVIARTRADVGGQRFVNSAFGAGLDHLGADMRAPRFPPRPHSPDPQTVALWHCDDPAGAALVDETVRLGAAGHAAMLAGGVSFARGKFGGGLSFPPSGGGARAGSSPDFDIAAAADATMEAFFAARPPADNVPRALLARRSAETAAGAANVAGWSLCLVNARGISGNVLFAVCDGAREFRVYADSPVADGAFHHVAGMIDRKRNRARIFVDGAQCASIAIDTLGAVAPANQDVTFGATANGAALGNFFSGVLDEVRISRVARSTFHPVLGEDDSAYRARLRIFRRWTLPSRANLEAMINQAAPFPADPAPYRLRDSNRAAIVAALPLRITPTALKIGTGLGLDGARARDETILPGPDADAGFDPALDLIHYVNPLVDSSGDPGGARMQAATGLALDALAARLAAAGIAGKIKLVHSFDPAGPTPLHGVGRALRLRHSLLGADALGAHAHGAGFGFAFNLGVEIAVAVAPGDRLTIRAAPTLPARADAGASFDLAIDPPQSANAAFSWTLISPGPAQAHFAPHSADPPDVQVLQTSAAAPVGATVLAFAAVPGNLRHGMAAADLTHGAALPAGAALVSSTPTTITLNKPVQAPGVAAGDSIRLASRSATPIAARPRVRLVTQSAGDLAVRVEVSIGGRTRAGIASLRLDPVKLADGHAFDAAYRLDPDPAPILGAPDAGFDPAWLATHPAQPNMDFGADPNNAKMQIAAREALDRLAALLAARAVPGKLKILAAYAPGAPGVESVGRRLTLAHETLDAGVLGALAARFFDHVARSGAAVAASVRRCPWTAIRVAATGAAPPSEIPVGATLTLAGFPAPAGSSAFWSLRPIGQGRGECAPAGGQVTFTARAPGMLSIILTQLSGAGDGLAPYTFDITLNPALDQPGAIIPKAQYDIVMNVLDALRPIGVEIRTENIRKYVVEIQQDATKAFPAYSFTNFRY